MCPLIVRPSTGRPTSVTVKSSEKKDMNMVYNALPKSTSQDLFSHFTRSYSAHTYLRFRRNVTMTSTKSCLTTCPEIIMVDGLYGLLYERENRDDHYGQHEHCISYCQSHLQHTFDHEGPGYPLLVFFLISTPKKGCAHVTTIPENRY